MISVTARAPAKVNLLLHIGPQRDDGYHDLVTVFHSVSVYDDVTVTPAARLSVAVRGETGIDAASVPSDERNLAARAVTVLGRHTGRRPTVAVSIHKRIPVAAGMAGGSADAAAALVACNELWNTGLSPQELAGLGAELGSDVPFMVLGGTAVGRGRGERLEPIPAVGPFHWVFAGPADALLTAEAYRAHSRLREPARAGHALPEGPTPSLLRALRHADPHALGRELHNDIDPTVRQLRPDVGRLLTAGRAWRALGALVCGTGPTCAFLTATAEDARVLRERFVGLDACAWALAAHGPVPGIETGIESRPGAAGQRHPGAT